MKADSLYDRPVVVNLQEDEGTVEGYVVNSNAVQIVNWFSKHGIDNDALIAEIRAKYPRIAMLNNVNVYDEFKGQGYGNFLLGRFIDDVGYEDAKAILLIADTAESQAEGFDLVQWYAKNGFAVLHQTGGGPLMLKEL
jgi:GNAT superfamily N-acetyltransferase